MNASPENGGNSMSPEEYMKTRVDDQLSWYDKKSQTNQKTYKRLRLVEIFSAASIPLLTGFMPNTADVGNLEFKILIGVLGLVITVITAVMGLYRFQENWVE